MKRISVFTIAVLMLMHSVTNAHYYHIPVRFRTRYSPYAFSYNHPSGLICGDLQYSPYAFSYNYPSGLVPYYVRYSPYAFSYENPSGLVPYYFSYHPYAFSHKHPSGLISEYCSYYCLPYAYSCRSSGLVDCDTNFYRDAYSYKPAVKPPAKYLSTQLKTGLAPCLTQSPKRGFNGSDGKEIIYGYLKSNNIDDFDVDRLLKIDNKTISVNFVFRDKNIIIKYWNPEEIQSLMQQAGYQKSYYQKYEQQWKDFCREYKEKGGKVYQIESADKEEILSKLSLCQELIEG